MWRNFQIHKKYQEHLYCFRWFAVILIFRAIDDLDHKPEKTVETRVVANHLENPRELFQNSKFSNCDLLNRCENIWVAYGSVVFFSIQKVLTSSYLKQSVFQCGMIPRTRVTAVAGRKIKFEILSSLVSRKRHVCTLIHHET